MTTIAKVDLRSEAASSAGDWKNWVLANVNDHVVRISVMHRDFHWHRHSNSDEVLMPLEGNLIVDFEDQSMTVGVGEPFETVPSPESWKIPRPWVAVFWLPPWRRWLRASPKRR